MNTNYSQQTQQYHIYQLVVKYVGVVIICIVIVILNQLIIHTYHTLIQDIQIINHP